jgi:hypothetical protein
VHFLSRRPIWHVMNRRVPSSQPAVLQPCRSGTVVCPPNDTAVQRRTHEGAERARRPSVCNGLLGGTVDTEVLLGDAHHKTGWCLLG